MNQSSCIIGTKFCADEHSVKATHDLLPGEVVFSQHEPIVFIPATKVLNGVYNRDLSIVLEVFQVFCLKLSPTEQIAFKALRSTGSPIQELQLAGESVTIYNATCKKMRVLNDSELCCFIDVAAIVCANVICVEHGFAIYGSQALSRMSHSCNPNCIIEIMNGICTCRVIKPIAVGEELLVEFNTRLHFEPVHRRRQQYFQTRGFTCSCVRCDNAADDTRLFRCVHPGCYGTHFVLNTCEENAYHYGTQLQGSRLLPCTACGTVPSLDFQSFVLQWETTLPDKIALILQLGHDVLHKRMFHMAAGVLQQISQAIAVCPQHVLCLEALRVGYQMWLVHVLIGGNGFLSKFYRAVDNYVSTFRLHHKLPSDAAVAALLRLVRDLLHAPTLTTLRKAHACCAWALRMHLILHGRDGARGEVDRLMAAVLVKMDRFRSGQSASVPPDHTSAPVGQSGLLAEPLTGEAIPPLTPTANAKANAEDKDSSTTRASDCAEKMSPKSPASPTLTPIPSHLAPSVTLVCVYCWESPLRAACKIKHCAQCRQATYCSVGCQRAHWKVHHRTCVPQHSESASVDTLSSRSSSSSSCACGNSV